MQIAINPPPQNLCCQICGKHVKELKPFGKEGDPLVGDFEGALLVKTFRNMLPKKTEKELIKYEKKHGKENREIYEQMMDTIEASWECRSCICLNDQESFEKKEIK